MPHAEAMKSNQAGGAAGAAPRRLLAVSFCYPPMASPRAVQVSRLLKHLPLSTVLVCADYAGKDRSDASLVAAAEAPLAACLRVPFARSGLGSLFSRIGHRFDLPLVNKLPDSYRAWKPAALAAYERFARQNAYAPDVLATFGSPMSDHLVGLALKRRLGVPWVAHFSDPWADNRFLGYDALARRLNRRLEARVVREADCLVFTSTETVELMMGKHPPALRSKARVLPHAYDPGAFDGQAAGGGAAPGIVIRYLGNFYGPRTPGPLFRGLRRLLDAEPEVLSGVRFELIGTKGEGQLEAAGIGLLPEGLVVSRPTVKYLESLRLMSSADGLLVADAPAEVSVFLPSKLIDYVGAARPILALSPRGAAAALVRRLGGWVADPSDDAAVAAELKSFVNFLRGRKSDAAPWGDADVRRSLAAPAVAAAFERMLRELPAARSEV
ncbi:MAG TPA: glycosyltransferase [Pyrinomonadaceae bacterium]|nr:glycosyltransferase [Pyrinomonadaceae bacterium]